MKEKKIMIWLRFLPLIMIAVFAIILLITGKSFNVDTVLSFIPQNTILAIAIILMMYAAKSMSFLLPIVVLYVAVGALFEPFTAIIVNAVGTIICIGIPYWVGYFSGAGYAGKLLNKYPKVKTVVDKLYENEWFMSYFLRVISFLPGEIISIYLGSIRIPYHKYLIAGFFGVLPSIITTTLIGISITDPTSPMFIFSVVLTIVLSIASIVFYRILQKTRVYINNKNGNSLK